MHQFGTFGRLLIATCMIALAAASASADFMFAYGGHTYLVSQTNRTWQAAATDAASRRFAGASGHLAVIETAAENQAIFSQLLANIPPAQFDSTRAPDGGNGAYVWIGANDIASDGTWIWDGDGNGSGTPFWQGTGASGGSIGGLYQNFGHYPTPTMQWEPDNAAGGLQDAAGMGLADWPRGVAGEWNDVRPDNALLAVVEFDAVPEPSSILLLAAASFCPAFRTRRFHGPKP